MIRIHVVPPKQISVDPHRLDVNYAISDDRPLFCDKLLTFVMTIETCRVKYHRTLSHNVI